MDTSTRITTRLQGKLGELWLKRMWTGITFSILIMVLGVAAGCSSGSDEEATQPQILVKTSAKWLPPPTSMDELIGDADVIAIGRVGPVIREVEEGGWDQNGQPTEGILHTHTYYQLELEEVIRDDGTVASGEPVLLRMLRSLQTGREQKISEEVIQKTTELPYAMPQPGQRRLFVLSKYPNGSYSTEGVNGLLDIDGDVVKLASHDARPVDFAAGQSVDQFLTELKRMAAKTDSSP